MPPEPDPIEAGRAAPEGTYGSLDVLHYDLDIALPDPGETAIHATATLTLRPTRAGVTEAVLDFTGLAVREVTRDGQVVDARLADGRLSVPLPDGASPADTFSVVIAYEGVPDDGLIVRDNVHGRPSVFADNWPNRARFWFPAVDHPSDKATASFTVHAPASWAVVANGALVGEPEPDGMGRRTWHWATDVAVSAYNLVVGGAEMEVVPVGLAACGRAPASPREDGCVEVSAWLFREDTAQARTSFGRAAEMVDFFSALIGPYQYEKLAHVQSATRFGGMENASAIFYTEQGLASGQDMEGTVSHETAHQWFGDAVTEADWPELWLSEGFATYFGHLFFEHADGRDALTEAMEQDRKNVVSSNVIGQAVIDRDEQNLFALLNANNYPKGGWVLHMLRGMVGDDAFFRGIRAYYALHEGKNVTSGDLRAAMELASGMDLEWFFTQWLEEPGYPALRTEWSWDQEAGVVDVTVIQTQDGSWPTFRLPVDVEIGGPDGQSVRHRVEVRQRTQVFRIPVDFEPAGVVLDPDGWVLKGDAGEE